MKAGTKVHYIPYKGAEKEIMENGFIKSQADDDSFYFVVYHWSNEPKNYMNYTGALTFIDDLKLGWI